MAIDEGPLAWVKEAMASSGQVTHRAMMGGATLYCDGLIFAIMASSGGLWFKADATTDAAWDAADCPRFGMTSDDGEIRSMNYRRAPDDCYDDADALTRWAALALEAGKRAPVAKARRRRTARPVGE